MSRVLILVFVLMMFPVGSVFAQENTAALPPAALELFNNGITAAKLPDYSLAIRYFEQANSLASGNSEILFNLALAESKLPGHELRSIAWFKTYLAADPSAANASQVREQINTLEVKVESSMGKLIMAARQSASQYSGEFQRNIGLSSVAEAQAISGDIVGARQTAESLADWSYTDTALDKIALVQANNGDFGGAKQTVQTIQESYPNGEPARAADFELIAEIQAKEGDIPGAESTLSNVTRPVLTDLAYKALIAIAQTYLKKGDKQSAYAAFVRSRDAITKSKRSTDPHGYRDSNYYYLIQAQADAGDIQGSLQTITFLEQQQGPVFDYRANSYDRVDEAYDKLARSQLQSGDVQAATVTANKITGLGTKNYIKKELLDAIAGYVKGPASNADNSATIIGAQQPQTAQEQRDKKIEQWTKLIDDELSKPEFTDFQSYIQSLSNKPTPDAILSGLLDTVKDLAGMLQEIKKLDDE